MSNKINIFETPVLQTFLVKTNLTFNLENLVEAINISNESNRAGTIIALKYKKIIKGDENLFKTKNGFKNACHLVIYHTLFKRKKKMVHIKITNIGTFQVIGIPQVDVEKVMYKLYILLEKLNKNNDVFTAKTYNENDRLEIVIIPILCNFMIMLDHKVTKNIFENSKVDIIQKFIDKNFVAFFLPNDRAITIKKSFDVEDFINHPIKYVCWNKKQGRTIQHIAYESYTTLLDGVQKQNALNKKYLTFRLFSTGNVLISGFDENLIKKDVYKFLKICDSF
jgi:hypothetical protein